MELIIHTGVLEVSGHDAKKFLQSLLSNDVDMLKVSNSQRSLLLTPKGKIISAMYIARIEKDKYLLVMEPDKVDVVHETLQRLLIRTKATIENISSKYLAVIGTDSEVFLDDNYANSGMTITLTPYNDQQVLDRKVHEDFRISFGAVSSVHDIDGAIPQEASLEKRAISFNKGCYLGQELVARMDSRNASTPYQYYASDTDVIDVGEVTSERQQSEADGIRYGKYKTIVRVKRSEPIPNDRYEKVQGGFSI